MLHSVDQAYDLLESLGAPKRLMVHAHLVGEAAEELLAGLWPLGVEIDQTLVRLGAALHDVGKTVHPNELAEPGHEHEMAGQILLLGAGVRPEIARFCLNHAQFETMEVCIEELLVALADKLWKGRRASCLELRVIDEVARLLVSDRWQVFSELDGLFEQIASGGDQRLARSFHNSSC